MVKKTRLIKNADRILGSTATAIAAVAGVGLVGETQQAQAQIIYSGPVNISIPLTTSGVYLNVVTGISDPSPGNVPGWDVNPWSSTNLNWFNPGAPAGGVYVVSGGLPTNLAFGTLIDGASTYGSGSSAANFNFNSSDNYVGFRFQDENDGNQTKYGWLQVQLGATFTDPARAIIGYAYENTAGVGIAAGAGVPEPTSLALLSVGAGGLAAYRRFRRKAS